MAWCRQATSHYLSQCWPRSMLPNGVTRPQWVLSRKNLIWRCEAKFTMEQPFIMFMLPILSWQYHAYGCPADLRSQCISRHGIGPQTWNIQSPASEELITKSEEVLIQTNHKRPGCRDHSRGGHFIAHHIIWECRPVTGRIFSLTICVTVRLNFG